jgi:hypothetical protein
VRTLSHDTMQAENCRHHLNAHPLCAPILEGPLLLLPADRESNKLSEHAFSACRTTFHAKMPCTNSHHGHLISLKATRQCFLQFDFCDSLVCCHQGSPRQPFTIVVSWSKHTFPSPVGSAVPKAPQCTKGERKTSNPKQNTQRQRAKKIHEEDKQNPKQNERRQTSMSVSQWASLGRILSIRRIHPVL